MRLYPRSTRSFEKQASRFLSQALLSDWHHCLDAPWMVHRDPALYSNPLAFAPERWTDNFEADLPRFGYFPFRGSPRRCLGDQFAMLEARLVLATLIQQVHFELVSLPLTRVFVHNYDTTDTRNRNDRL